MHQESKYQIYDTTQAAWKGMMEAIRAARTSVYWELYMFIDDHEGLRFFDLLEQKAKDGVDVKLVVDSLGSFWLSRKTISRLRKSGIDIVFFHERKKKMRGWWRRLWARNHRKVLVVDESVGFIGGVNVGKLVKDWIDITVRLEGKVVHSLLRAFAKSYIISGGERKKVKHLFKYTFRVAKDMEEIEYIYDEAFSGRSATRKKYVEALTKARERVIIFSPYYFPDKKFLHALWKARKRGVRVDVLIPFRTDLRLMTFAAYTWFGLMKKRGVRVHLLNKMMHAKGVIVDNDWAMVGSSNINHTSFYETYEANVKINHKGTVRKLKERVLKWIAGSTHVDNMYWEKRGSWHKFKEWVSLKLYRIWHNKGD